MGKTQGDTQVLQLNTPKPPTNFAHSSSRKAKHVHGKDRLYETSNMI